MTPATSPEFDSLIAYVSGEVFSGFPFRIRVDGSPPTNPLSLVEFSIYTIPAAAAPLIVLSSTTADITITSAANWEGTVLDQELNVAVNQPLPPGNYGWKFVATDNAGIVQTYGKGRLEAQINPP